MGQVILGANRRRARRWPHYPGNPASMNGVNQYKSSLRALTGRQTGISWPISAGAVTSHAASVRALITDRGTRGPAAQRPGWQDTVADLREGDVLVVPSPASLARSQAELHHLMSELSTRGVHVELTDAPAPGVAATQELLKQMRDDLLAEITAERHYWQAQYDGRRGRHRRLIDPEHELATIEGFDTGAPREQLAFQLGISRAQLYRIAAAGADDN